jgi:hypothetical protein
MKNKYDAFLSHDSQDKPIVEKIAQWLEDKANLSVWLDKWNLIPGDPWQEEIEKALDESQCCVVFLGPKGIGPWQNEEMRTAIEERVSKQTIRVVPVLLPGAVRPGQESKLPRFLRRLTWVDFQQNWNDALGDGPILITGKEKYFGEQRQAKISRLTRQRHGLTVEKDKGIIYVWK